MSYEDTARVREYPQVLTRIVGVDDSGGGSLAGPITACAFYAPARVGRSEHGHLTNELLTSWRPPGSELVQDCKRLRRGEMKRAARWLREFMENGGGTHCVGMVSAEERRNTGDRVATGTAMARALRGLRALLEPDGDWPPDLLVVDGSLGIPGISMPQRRVVDADVNHWHVSAASILAARARQEYMEGVKGDGWRFGVHLGFATEDHAAALRAAVLRGDPLHSEHIPANVRRVVRKARAEFTA